MNLRRIFKPLAAAILAVGLVTAACRPGGRRAAPQRPTKHTYDTGWGFK